jgi:hypothetical protein
MNHACAFGASGEVNAFARHFERGGSGFGLGVRGADGERDFREGTRGGTKISGEFGKGAQDFFDWELDADNPGGADENFASGAAETSGGFRNGAFGGGVALRSGGAISVAGVDDDGAHASFGGAEMVFADEDGSGDDEILGEDRGSGGGKVTGEDGEIKRASFF